MIMKNVKIFTSVSILMLAIAGAFATSSAKADSAALVQGYIKQGLNCVPKNLCETTNTGTLCTETQIGGAQIYAMDSFGDCTVPVWRRP